MLTKGAGGAGRETNLQRSADNAVRLGHKHGYCVVGRGGRENEDQERIYGKCLHSAWHVVDAREWLRVLSSLSYIRLCAQRSKASLPVSDCCASSHPLHLLQLDFLNNEKHPILSLCGSEKLFLMPRTLCSQLLAKLAPSRPSGLRVNATSPERPFLKSHHPQSYCLSCHMGYFLLRNYQKLQ